jgi:hypothetical protein
LTSKNTKALASLAIFFCLLSLTYSILGQLFPDLANNSSELLASLASVFENISTPLGEFYFLRVVTELKLVTFFTT